VDAQLVTFVDQVRYAIVEYQFDADFGMACQIVGQHGHKALAAEADRRN
jgi:hypothetical protein